MAETGKWWLHSGQTFWFCSTCLRKSVAWQPSQRIQTPSGTRLGSKCPCQAFTVAPCLMAGSVFQKPGGRVAVGRRGGGAGGLCASTRLSHRTSERPGSLFSMAVAVRVGGDLDPFEAAGGDAVLELDPRVAAEVAGDELGD